MRRTLVMNAGSVQTWDARAAVAVAQGIEGLQHCAHETSAKDLQDLVEAARVPWPLRARAARLAPAPRCSLAEFKAG